MRLGVNVPNFGPGTDPGMIRHWAQTVEGLGFDLLMVSDHVAITPDVAAKYPAPFYEPFTTLSWLAGVTTRVALGTTVLIVPYRHPLLVARMAANLNDLSGGRLVLGVGIGWARQEFEALGVAHDQRGRITDEHLAAITAAWADERDYRGRVPIWVGGESRAALLRTVRFGQAWHPLWNTLPYLRETYPRVVALAAEEGVAAPALAPRIQLRVTPEPVTGTDRLAGVGTIEQIMDDLEELRVLGAETVVLDPFHGDPEQTLHPETSWEMLAAVIARRSAKERP